MKFLHSKSECLFPKTYNLICHMPILWDIAENSSRGFKKIITPLKIFFFHVWDIQDTFYMCKKKKKFKGRPKKYFLIPLSPPQKSCFYKKSHIFLCLSDSEKKNLKNLKLCLYSEILPKIQVGCLKKF